MKISVVAGRIENQKTGAIIIPVFQDEKLPRAASRIDARIGGVLGRGVTKGDFKPKAGSAMIFYPAGKIGAERVVLTGLGKKKDFSLDRLRHAAGKAATYARQNGARDIMFVADGLGSEGQDLSQAITKAHEVEAKEEDVDRIERRILQKLYEAYRNGEFGILKLVELKNTATRLGDITDRAEDASDRVMIMVAKRRG